MLRCMTAPFQRDVDIVDDRNDQDRESAEEEDKVSQPSANEMTDQSPDSAATDEPAFG